MKNNSNIYILIGTMVLMIAMFFVGRMTMSHSGGEDHSQHPAGGGDKAATKKDTKWTCSMHPQIILPKSGLCPICRMDLIPLKKGEDLGPTTYQMSEHAKKLAEIETTQIGRKYVNAEVRMVGKVAYDERRVNTISAWVPGRIDRLFVDYTGIRVGKGEHLAEFYSPKLLTAQQELLEAKKRFEESSEEQSQFLKESNLRTLTSARKKLELWGLTKEQIKNVESTGKATDHMTIYAPGGGVVVKKFVNEGDYVNTGTKVMTIADFSHLWILMDAYESDLPYMHYAQKVKMTTNAFPGEEFEGSIAFIHPELNEKTRTIKVRVNVKNPDLKLKPGMFVSAKVYSRLAEEGKVLRPSLAGKWISPMHPEIVKDKPGNCDICGMKLVPADKYGYVEQTKGKAPIVVPVTAVLKTGKRAVIYIEHKNKKKPTFEGVEVQLGPRAGNYYIVNSGLEGDEWVVVNGNFKIDSALQIMAKPSMMNQAEEEETDEFKARQKDRRSKLKLVITKEIRASLSPIYSEYLNIQKALASDQFKEAKDAFKNLNDALSKIDQTTLSEDTRVLWVELSAALKKAIEHGHHSADIKQARSLFEGASLAIIELEEWFGHAGKNTHFVAFCPMALNNKGAVWLQDIKDIKNPYFGASMLACGEIRKTLNGADGKKESKPKNNVEEKKKEKVEPTKKASLDSIYQSYVSLQQALASDDFKKAKAQFKVLEVDAEGVDVSMIPEQGKKIWKEQSKHITMYSSAGKKAKDMATARKEFENLSKAMIKLIKVVEPSQKDYFRMYCSMAFKNKGASWLQDNKDLRNPYFGSQMLGCGSIEETFKKKNSATKTKKHKHEGSDK